MPFPFELAQRAYASSIASMGTSTLAVVGSLIYPLSETWREFTHSRWSGVQKHWKETLRYSLAIGLCWWSILFSYHLFYKVPREINMEAQSIRIPRPSIPPPPRFAYVASEKSAPKSPMLTPAFLVDIEHRIVTLPGPYGTSFWFGSFGRSSCSLEPTGAAIFLRITNLQRHKEMITAYSIDGLAKTPVTHGRMFIILPKGQIGSGFVPQTIDFGAPAGIGALVHFPVDDADTSKAIPVTGDFLDYKIGEGHYLEPDESVRGWVFLEYRKGYVEMPVHLAIKVTDQFQHSFTYPIPDHVGDPEGDILLRRIVEGPLEDLSRCVVHK